MLLLDGITAYDLTIDDINAFYVAVGDDTFGAWFTRDHYGVFSRIR